MDSLCCKVRHLVVVCGVIIWWWHHRWFRVSISCAVVIFSKCDIEFFGWCFKYWHLLTKLRQVTRICLCVYKRRASSIIWNRRVWWRSFLWNWLKNPCATSIKYLTTSWKAILLSKPRNWRMIHCNSRRLGWNYTISCLDSQVCRKVWFSCRRKVCLFQLSKLSRVGTKCRGLWWQSTWLRWCRKILKIDGDWRVGCLG